MLIIFVMQGKCLFSDISRPESIFKIMFSAKYLALITSMNGPASKTKLYF